tara:strand:- start:1018 stop:1206 length:189 start_codon:yes stop_codon:yes gene_type:complete
MILDYTEIDPSGLASSQLAYFAQLEEQEEGRFSVDDYEYAQCLSMSANGRLACAAYHREFDL